MVLILSPEQNIVTNWSGGQTRQLFIYPKDAEFKSGDFKFRISTATVEVDESVFTKLPDVKRTLVVLEGQMSLFHQNQHQKHLHPFEIDNFSGDWDTVSKGQCADFNLMTKGNVKSIVTIKSLKANQNEIIDLSGTHFFIYSHHETINLDYSENHMIQKKELALFTRPFSGNQFILHSKKDCNVICIQVDV